MDVFENAPEQALAWHKEGRGAVLATVVETWGSAPRRIGAQLVIAGDGEMQGSVSGGCVEGAVVLEAVDALEKGVPALLEYGVSDGDAFAVGLACGGTIRIGSPVPGSSTLISLAPRSSSCRAKTAPGNIRDRSTTSTPASGPRSESLTGRTPLVL